MKLTIQILLSLAILAIFGLAIFAPGMTEALAVLGLFAVCVVVAIKQGIMRAVVLFLKEMW
jgi:hypothetical protein